MKEGIKELLGYGVIKSSEEVARVQSGSSSTGFQKFA
jgi:hypothetical protein